MKKTNQDISSFTNTKQNKTVPVDLIKDQQILAAALSDVSMALNSSLNLDEVLDRILENLTKVVPNKTSNIMLLDGQLARIVRSKGYDLLGTKDILMSRVFDTDQIPNFQKMIKSRQPVLIYNPHLDQDWHILPESEWIKSHIGAPILSDETVIGFLNCDSDVEGYYEKSQLSAIQLFADHAGLAIRNARLYDASTNLSKKLRLINDLTHQVLEAKTLNEILGLLPEKLIELLQAANVYISKWDEETKTASGWATSGERKREYLSAVSKPGDRTITEGILEARHATLVADITESSVMDSKFYELYREKTILGLPLIAEGIKFGAILIGFNNPDQVTEDIISLGEYTALQISTAIAKIYTLEQERNQSSQLAHANALIETLSRVSSTIKSGVNTKNVMTTIGTELELLKIHSLVALKVGSTDTLSLAYSSVQSTIIPFVEKFGGNKINDLHTSIDALPIIKDLIETQKAKFLENPEELLKQITPPVFVPLLWKLMDALELTRTAKCILVPLVAEKQSIGILSLWGESLQIIDIQAAAIFGGQVAIAIENANLLQEVQRLAVTDELTNVLNRRGFDEVANREFEISKRYARPLSMIMLDIDHFKATNDTYGHSVGDEILKEIAFRCRTKIRETDFISRHGGEEFLILLIEQKRENARLVAERIRKYIADQPFVTTSGKIKVTVSLGVCSLDSQTTSISMMVKKVDKALYVSKENGRNRVTLINNK